MSPEDLLEYEKLKEEQVSRIGARDNLLNYNLVALGVVATVSAGLQNANFGLLIAPWISAIFGWAYLQHDEKISAIGRYIKSRYSGSAFAWEGRTKQVALPKSLHKGISLFVLLLAFAVPCVIAPVIWFQLPGTHSSFFVVVAIFECALGAGIGTVTVIGSDFVTRYDHDQNPRPDENGNPA